MNTVRLGQEDDRIGPGAVLGLVAVGDDGGGSFHAPGDSS
jgi:hypothetical protein